MSFNEVTASLKRKRSGYKGRVTFIVKDLEKRNGEKTLRQSYFTEQKSVIKNLLEKINDCNDEIFELSETNKISCDDEARKADRPTVNENDYHMRVTEKLAELTDIFQPMTKAAVQAPVVATAKEHIRVPKLSCKKFSGTEKDKFYFNNFLKQFENVIEAGGITSGSAKLTYLFGYLENYAFDIVSHLSIKDDNYPLAIKLLKDEFLDVEFLIHEYLRKILLYQVNFDDEFSGSKRFINDVRSYVQDLKNFELDFLKSGSAGLKLLSDIVFQKLPTLLRRELIRKVGNPYPNLIELFDNYHQVIKTILSTSNPQRKIKSSGEIKTSHRPELKSRSPALQGFNIQSSGPTAAAQLKTCKFCNGKDHNSGLCSIYDSYEKRKQFCVDKNLCTRCLSQRHTEEKCFGKQNNLTYPCKICGLKSHNTAMCKRSKAFTNKDTDLNLCLNSNTISDCNEIMIMPMMSINISNGNESVEALCLLDTGSEKSYMSTNVYKALKFSEDNAVNIKHNIKTFLGSGEKSFIKSEVGISIQNLELFRSNVLFDDNFDISLKVPLIEEVFKTLKFNNLKPAATINNNLKGETLIMDGLIGLDILNKLKIQSVRRHMPERQATVWEFCNGHVPLGPLSDFLHPHQKKSVGVADKIQPEKHNGCFFTNILKQYGKCSESAVNFVLSPKSHYQDPLESIFEESQVERNLDQLFSLESIGINSNEKDVAQTDLQQVNEFKNNIELIDGKYHVKLLWKEDMLKQVSSNYQVALKVLERVSSKLENENILEDYLKVFKQQEEDGIIEEIKVDPKDYGKYVWLPHRPILKKQAQVTTKIRPVFNCSLKTSKNSVSLNNAAFPGINLMKDMIKLLLTFRTNDYTLLADIKKAFLMIKLKCEEDKNRFCFFLKEGSQLKCYRYTTVLFGFISSPFILNYVIKHHIKTFENDKCSEILNNNFFVDDLVVSHNDPDVLYRLYKESNERMA